jgi:hypothetical protein
MTLPYILSRFRGCDYRRGIDWIFDILTHLYIPLRITSNYGIIANLHTLQLTTVSAKNLPVCNSFNSRSLVTASNSGDSSASHAQVLLLQPPVQNSWKPSTQLQRHLFSVSLAELHWTANLQLNSLTNQLLHFTSFNWTALIRPGVFTM